MDVILSRRTLIGAGLALPLLALPACATIEDYGGFGLEDSIRRLLTLSSQRAFATLLTENGFFQDEMARVTLPPELGGSGAPAIAAALLRTGVVQDQLLRLVNRAAVRGAERAAPVIYDSIKTMTITDAMSLVRGGPNAATDYLRRSIGDRIVEVLLPGVGDALRLLDSGLLNRALQGATGIDFAGVQQDVTRKAADGIWRAIGREEAEIRANPEATQDPVLNGVFGFLRRS